MDVADLIRLHVSVPQEMKASDDRQTEGGRECREEIQRQQRVSSQASDQEGIRGANSQND